MRGVDRGRDDTILEGEAGVRDTVVLDPRAGDAKARRQARRLDERREAGIEREHRLAVEGQPLAIAPERWRPPRDRCPIRQVALGGIQRLERTETILTDGDGCPVLFRTAQTATLGEHTETVVLDRRHD